MKTEFIIDCLKNYWCLDDVATKYNMTIDEVIDKYHQETSELTNEELDQITSNMLGGNNE